MAAVRIKNLVLGEGIPKICIPVSASGKEELALKGRAALEAGADLVEWRVDKSFGRADLAGQLKALSRALEGLPLLFTLRTAAEGGDASPSEEEYEACLLEAADSGLVDLADVEVFQGEKERRTALIRRLQEKGIFVIGSSHDFAKTDDIHCLIRKLMDTDQMFPDILKMAVMASSFADTANLMSACSTMRLRTERPVIAIAMGADGRLSRIAGESFGSCLTFGTAGEASAPGQLPAGQLRELLELLHRGAPETSVKPIIVVRSGREKS